MLAASVDFGDSRVAGNSNFARFELVLQRGEGKSAVLSLAPTVDLPVVAAQERCVATARYRGDVSHWDVLDQDGRVFESDWVVDAELTVFIGAHRVDVVIESNEAGVAEAARHLPDRNVVAAELGERVALVTCQVDSKAKLSMVVGSPREYLCVLGVICLDVENALGWRTAS